MTLVISCITPDFVLQVSDRRLVRGSRLEDDDRNKAVLMFHAMVFAYTGLAYIGSERTDVWLTHAVRDANSLSDALSHVAARATSAFQALPVSRQRYPHAFAAVGWGVFDGSVGLEPFFASVSNYLGPQRQPGAVRPRFETQIGRLGRGVFFGLDTVGQPLTRDEAIRLHRLVRRALAGGRARPQAVGRILGLQVRQVAARNDAVGAGLLVNCLPRPRGKGSVVLTPGEPELDRDTFLYVPAGDVDGWEYPPQIVLPGGSALIDSAVRNVGTFIKFGSDEPEDPLAGDNDVATRRDETGRDAAPEETADS